MDKAIPLSAAGRRLQIAERKKKRAKRIMRKFQNLPTTIDNPFFDGLLSRWTETPTLAAPISQICTTKQFAEPDYSRICALLGLTPQLHRKQWEFMYIYRCIEQAQLIGAGRRGLVFG